MYFPHAFRKTFLAINGTPAAAGNSTTHSSLTGTAGTLGFYAPTSASNSALVSLTATGGTGANSLKPFYLIQSSYFTNDKIGAHGGYKESIKSKLINPKYISRVIKVSAKTAFNQVVRVSASAFVASNQTYRLRLDLKGSPALRFLNHQMYRTVDAYTGVVGSGNTYRDAASALLGWKEQINGNPFLSQYIQARVLVYKGTITASGTGTGGSTTQITIPTTSTTNVFVGQRIVNNAGTGLPANSWVSAVVANTSVTVKFPTQTATVATTASTFDVYDDVYSATENGVSTSGTTTYIPGTSISISTVGAASTVAATSAGAHILTLAADSASQTAQVAFLELTCAYVDTVFGNATFTPSDKYELEPIMIYASVVDELNNTNLSTSFVANTSSFVAGSHGVEAQAPVQAQGSGETVLREMILSNRYAQNAYPDSKFVDDIRQREIEADPALATITRSALYDQYIIVHNVPRWNNPSGMFDNDQYVINIYIPAGTAFSNVTDFFLASANLAQTGTASLSNLIALETY